MKAGRHVVASIAATILLLGSVFAVHAETTNCTPITYLPYNISTPGNYCLTSNLETSNTSGQAIAVYADNVVLDFNGYKIDNTPAGASTTAHGIWAFGKDFVVKNGTVKAFYTGIQAGGGTSTVIEDMTFDQNAYMSILMNGSGIIARRNHVVNAGIIGIYAVGKGNVIADNQIYNFGLKATSGTPPYGILLSSDFKGNVYKNIISNPQLGTESSMGIAVFGASTVLINDNEIMNTRYGIFYTSTATGKYKNNTTLGVTTPYTGGTSTGNNN